MLELDFSQQLGDLDLQVTQTLPGQGITAIFGLSGAGKTSLINAIGGLTKPDSGRISLMAACLSDAQEQDFSAAGKAPYWLCFSGCAAVPALSRERQSAIRHGGVDARPVRQYCPFAGH